MLKLIKLEWKKNNIGKYIRNVVREYETFSVK